MYEGMFENIDSPFSRLFDSSTALPTTVRQIQDCEIWKHEIDKAREKKYTVYLFHSMIDQTDFLCILGCQKIEELNFYDYQIFRFSF